MTMHDKILTTFTATKLIIEYFSPLFGEGSILVQLLSSDVPSNREAKIDKQQTNPLSQSSNPQFTLFCRKTTSNFLTIIMLTFVSRENAPAKGKN